MGFREQKTAMIIFMYSLNTVPSKEDGIFG